MAFFQPFFYAVASAGGKSMNPAQFKKALSTGQRVFGTLIVSPAPRWIKSLAGCGLDFVFIDTEHNIVSRRDLAWMCQAYHAVELASVVRIPSPDPYRACQVLDAGAAGIIAPYIETVQEVKELVGAVKFRPLKGERLRKILDGEVEAEATLLKYLDDYNRDNVLIVNIESVPALENLDALLAVPGLDGVLVGPHDLSCSLGLPENYYHPHFKSAVATIISKARKAGLSAGAHVAYPDENLAEETGYILEAGANLVIHSADVFLFQRALQRDLEILKKAVGEKVGPASEPAGPSP